jgi:hypothetical protein
MCLFMTKVQNMKNKHERANMIEKKTKHENKREMKLWS